MSRLVLLILYVWSGMSISQGIPLKTDRININRPPEESGNAFEGDIRLTPEEEREIARNGSLPGKRNRRQVVEPWKLWPKGIIVYKYDDDMFSNDANGLLAKRNIQKAMKLWEDTTCLRFRYYTPSTSAQLGHDSFVNIMLGAMCSSHIGRTNSSQEMEVGGACLKKIYSIAHEIGHTAGFYHEHTRPDRDNAISVNKDNVKPGAQNFFRITAMKLKEKYDVDSVMHYGPLFFSKDSANRKYTIVPKDPRLFGHLGQRSHLSFMNIKSMNDLYNCNRNCPRSLHCQNGGYIGPNCACTCPLDLTGRYCTEVVRSSSGCGGVLTGRYGKFTTPGFPNKYPASSSCTWLIQGPPGSSITLRFTTFKIEQDNSEPNYSQCFYDHVEVKENGPTLAGQRYCGNHRPPNVINYKGNALIVKFNSDTQYNFNGFEAVYTIH